MTPSPIKRLKPYFKPRPRTRSAPPASAPTPASGPTATTRVAPAQPAPAPGVAPQDGRLDLPARREQLAGRYAELQSDLGGLVYEMAIRDSFRLDLVVRKAAELQAVDTELSAVEQQLGVAPPQPGGTCPSCGSAVSPGARFCARCGSTVASPPAVSAAGGRS